MKQAIQLDVVSDVMCPWCYIGKRRMEQAISHLEEIDIKVDVRWRPYQLDPTLPPEGRDRKLYLEQKFGGPEKAREIYQNIEQAGKSEGLAFDFSAIAVSPNTIDAHRVIRWSANETAEVQDRLVERLFELFFMQGAHIGDHKTLVDAAVYAGMDGSIVAALLETEQDRDAVQQEISQAQHMGVTGVPCFIINNQYAVMGAQDPQHLIEAITEAAKQKGTS